MNLFPIRLPLLAAIAGLALLTFSEGARAGKTTAPPPVTYRLTFLDKNLTLAKMNEAGVAVGWTAGTTPLAKVRLANGTLVDLTELAKNSDPDYAWSLLDYAMEINASGQIAGRGWRIEAGVPQARLFRYSPAQGVNSARLEALRTFMGGTLHVEGINDYGDVLLHETKDGSPDGTWVASGLPGHAVATELLPLVGGTPSAINNFGQITGHLDTGTRSMAFRYTPGTSTTASKTELFGTISGSPATAYGQSNGNDINDLGVIAGSALKGRPTTGKEDTSPWAVRLNSSGTWETVAGGGSSDASAVNYQGVTVGTRTGVYGQGFVFLSGKTYSLKDLVVSPPANLSILLPKDITDGGQICGEAAFANPDGTYQFGGGFVLTPIVAP